jgi:hypothetical protein
MRSLRIGTCRERCCEKRERGADERKSGDGSKHWIIPPTAMQLKIVF